ncbi:NfeD family protein [Bergeriella denitrificans]|uniref:Nodulation efficiency NfeD family protein n=1 Tax=Bergeriella denitrificans TaxID=494 RepID=A0A378UFS0_BERDE|nr:NfeD family protein [Bergeriella denitrificans]STZ76145.1 nodulation efficiency NfeD family protein [Bergeriella denitrificans]
MTFWLIAAALVLILELFAGTVYLLVVCVALLGAGAVAALTDSTPAALLTAALLSAVFIWPVRAWARKHRRSKAQEAAENDLDIGQTVRIERHLHGALYEVVYRGAHWQARAINPADAAAAQSAVITGKEGNLLLVRLHSH